MELHPDRAEPAPSTEARQAGVIPFRRQSGVTTFCLITTSSGRRWTIPKGIIEASESARETALKEAMEEAGLHGELIGPPVGSYAQKKWGLNFTVDVFLMNVAHVDQQWPEASFRRRRWCDADTALALLKNRPVASVFRQAIEKQVNEHASPCAGQRPHPRAWRVIGVVLLVAYVIPLALGASF